LHEARLHVRAVEAGLTFVGPSPEAIAAMGSKTGSRRLMEKAGVPVVPGTPGPAAGAAELEEFGRRVGYPILLKASAGGGGKGMRRVDAAADVPAAFARVASEAEASFGDGAVFAEKLVERPRHIEVQVLGDSRGNLVAVGERECSIQRRHQKLLEESPSTQVTPELTARAWRVITFGCVDRCPIGAKEKSEDWPIPGSTMGKNWPLKSAQELHAIRDELQRRILGLIQEIKHST
jgi:acetyl/propionyl-CoA carboxylase alpha subunit